MRRVGTRACGSPAARRPRTRNLAPGRISALLVAASADEAGGLAGLPGRPPPPQAPLPQPAPLPATTGQASPAGSQGLGGRSRCRGDGRAANGAAAVGSAGADEPLQALATAVRRLRGGGARRSCSCPGGLRALALPGGPPILGAQARAAQRRDNDAA